MKKSNDMIPYAKKSALVIALLTIFTTISFSQSNTEEVDFYQSIFGMGKKQAVAEFLQLAMMIHFGVFMMNTKQSVKNGQEKN